MSRTIHKYDLPFASTKIPMPQGARVLHFGRQDGLLRVWAEGDLAAPFVERAFAVVGTGDPVPDIGRYVGTVPGDRSPDWHLYETTPLGGAS